MQGQRLRGYLSASGAPLVLHALLQLNKMDSTGAGTARASTCTSCAATDAGTGAAAPATDATDAGAGTAASEKDTNDAGARAAGPAKDAGARAAGPAKDA